MDNKIEIKNWVKQMNKCKKLGRQREFNQELRKLNGFLGGF